MTELTAVLDQPGLTDAERLGKVRELHSFARPYLRRLPESVRAEELSRPEYQAVLERLAREDDDLTSDEPQRAPSG